MLRSWLIKVGILALTSALAAPAFAAPAHIIILRHGEKNSDEDPNLSAKGYKRANALAKLFSSNGFISEYGSASAIFAASPGKKSSSSLRSVETVTPTADVLGIDIDSTVDKDDGKVLIQGLLKDPKLDGKTVIICWNHSGITDMMKSIYGKHNFNRKWKSSTFDRLWILTSQKGDDDNWMFEDIAQNVLPGDSRD